MGQGQGVLVGMTGWGGPTRHPHQCCVALASGGVRLRVMLVMSGGATVGTVGWGGPVRYPRQCRLAMASGGGG